jgi:hypothetical protein
MRYIRPALLFFLAFLSACDEDEAEFPELATAEAQQIGATSVVLEADITEIGSQRPVQYGFLWSTSSNLNVFNSDNRVDLGTTDAKRKFSIKLDGLTPGTTYFARAFVADPEFTRVYYGNEISFLTLN